MNARERLTIPSMKDRVSLEEWRTRVDLAACYRLVADLGHRNYLMLRNQGLLALGKTIADPFVTMYLFEAACMIQIRAQSGAGS